MTWPGPDDDPEIVRAYILADYLKVPLSAVKAMTLEEFEGWYKFLAWKKENDG